MGDGATSRAGLFAAGVALAALSVAGCGEETMERGMLSGSVTLDGKPLALGAITLEPLPGVAGEVTGGLVRDGRFSLVGKAAARPGRYRVRIMGSAAGERSATAEPAAKDTIFYAPPVGFTDAVAPAVATVAARYDAESTLEVEIAAGANTADFAVESQ